MSKQRRSPVFPPVVKEGLNIVASSVTSHVDLQLSGVHMGAMRYLLNDLMGSQATLKDGTPVVSKAHAIRWLLEQYYDSLPQETLKSMPARYQPSHNGHG